MKNHCFCEAHKPRRQKQKPRGNTKACALASPPAFRLLWHSLSAKNKCSQFSQQKSCRPSHNPSHTQLSRQEWVCCLEPLARNDRHIHFVFQNIDDTRASSRVSPQHLVGSVCSTDLGFLSFFSRYGARLLDHFSSSILKGKDCGVCACVCIAMGTAMGWN